MPTNASKAQRIAELEAELEELKKPVLLRMFGKDVKIVNSKRHAPKQKIYFQSEKTGNTTSTTAHVVPLIEYAED